MIVRLSRHSEKFAAGAGALLLLMGAGWWWNGRALLARLRDLPVTVSLHGPDFQATDYAQPAISIPVWRQPSAQSAGSGWVYELFAPPAIRYDPAAHVFELTPPASVSGRVSSLDVELLEVKRAPYRLQLVGYFGTSGGYTAAFSSSQSPGVLLAREGRRFEELGLTLKSVSVGRAQVGPDPDGALHEIAAQAVLEDGVTGKLVTLDSRWRRLTDAPLAVLRVGRSPAKLRSLCEGDSVQVGTTRYRVERIQLDPPEVVVVSTLPDQLHPEAHVLHPVSSQARTDGRPSPNSPRSRVPGQTEEGFARTDEER